MSGNKKNINNSQMVPNLENLESDQPVQSHSHAQTPIATTDLSAGAFSWLKTGLPSPVFQAVFEMSLGAISVLEKSFDMFMVFVILQSKNKYENEGFVFIVHLIILLFL